MSKTLKTFFIIFIIIIFSINIYSVQATMDNDDKSQYISEETMDVHNTVGTSDNENNNENENIIRENASEASIQSLTPSSVTSVSSKENYNSANLQLNNILCIILISIGVLLILLSIAILIRLKK